MFFLLLGIATSIPRAKRDTEHINTRYAEAYSRGKPEEIPEPPKSISTNEDPLPYYLDMKVLHVNREDPRASFVSYDDKKSALNAYAFADSPHYVLLNGVWQFYYVDFPKDLPADVTDKDVDPKNWTTINVPGNYEMQGHGVAMYTNVAYDFNPGNPNPPNLPDMVPVGVYRRTIDITDQMLERNLYLQVGGAKTGLYVYINGVEVGYSEDSKDPADFLINKYVTVGSNVLTLKIYKYSTASYMDDQDMWRFGGLERDVFLYTQPKLHIHDFSVVSTLDDTYTDGILRLNLSIRNQAAQKDKVTAEYELFDLEDLSKVVTSGSEQIDVDVDKKVKIQFANNTIKNIKKWSDEHPYLYKLIFTLKDSKGTILEIVPYRIGFRRTDFSTVKYNGKNYPVLLFNGKEVLYRGVNIHEHNEKTGHYVTDEIMRKDIQLLKQHNFNALRYCHYPQSRQFYELCDEFGLHVVSEVNIETHGMGYSLSKGGTLGNNPDWLLNHLERTRNMYKRTRNHASVTFFSLGNEAGNGYNFYLTYNYVKSHEVFGQNRPVNYERAEWEWNSDMFVPMYPSAGWFENMGKSGSDRPIVPCEYSHAMGNSNGNFYRIWEHIYKYPNLQGGFIWDWVDQGILEKGKGGRPFWTYGGDYGVDAPSDGNFNINGCINPDRDPHPAMAEIKYTHQFVAFTAVDISKGVFKIENRYFFTNLQNYDVSATIVKNGEVVRTEELSEASKLEPQTSANFNIKIDDLAQDIATEYFINFSVKAKIDLPNIPKGFEVAYDQFKLNIAALPRKDPTPIFEQSPALSIQDDENFINVTSSKVTLIYNKRDSIIKSYKVDGVEYINKEFGFQPNFWRAPTDNDYGNGAPKRQQIWKTLSRTFTAGCTYSIDDNQKIAQLKINFNLLNSIEYYVYYRIYANGVLKIKADYHGSKQSSDTIDLPRIGLRFRVPKDYENVQYLGLGPQENYWDRKNGVTVGRFTTNASSMYYPYVRPQENGHHMETRWVSIYQNDNKGGLLFCADLNEVIEFNILRNSIEDFDDEEQKTLPRQWQNFDDCFHKGGQCHHDEPGAVNVLRRQHHIDDITPQDFVEVNIDYRMMGVAGYNSWGDRPENQFTIPANKEYSYAFTIVPIQNKDEIDEKLQYQYQ